MTSPAAPHLLCGLLRQTAAASPDRTGLTDTGRSLTFQDMDTAARRLAAHLRANGVTTGDRIVLFMANSVDFVLAFWGTVYSGAVAVPVNADTKAAKLQWILNDCRPRALLVDADLLGCFRSAAPKEAPHLIVNDAAAPQTGAACLSSILSTPADAGGDPVQNLDQNLSLIIYTSGSTGFPKGVMLSHLNVLSAARSVAAYLGYRPTDKVFCAIPFTFDYGLHQITMTALTGACLQVEGSFSKPFFALHKLAKSGATVFPLVPTMAALIEPLADRFDLGGVRIVTNTAAALSALQIGQLRAVFPSAALFSMYGLTECHRCTYLAPDLLDTHPGSVGRAIPNTELWVIDDAGAKRTRSATGELVIRGSTVMKGYWQNPEETARKLKPGPMPGETVLHTGDICRLDEHGLLYFLARKDDVLKVRGEKVAPREVEDVLLAHPAVLQAVVLGVDDPVLGQKIVAFAELRPDTGLAPQALTDWCASRLESYMVPAEMRLVDAFARNENGKIDKLALRAGLTGGPVPGIAPIVLSECSTSDGSARGRSPEETAHA